jgi:hypothetical protein
MNTNLHSILVLLNLFKELVNSICRQINTVSFGESKDIPNIVLNTACRPGPLLLGPEGNLLTVGESALLAAKRAKKSYGGKRSPRRRTLKNFYAFPYFRRFINTKRSTFLRKSHKRNNKV